MDAQSCVRTGWQWQRTAGLGCSPENGPGPVGVVGQGPPEDDGGRGRPGDEQVCALGDHTDGRPGSHLHRHAVATVHGAAFHLHLEVDKGVRGSGAPWSRTLTSPRVSAAPATGSRCCTDRLVLSTSPGTCVKISALLSAQGDSGGSSRSGSNFLPRSVFAQSWGSGSVDVQAPQLFHGL